MTRISTLAQHDYVRTFSFQTQNRIQEAITQLNSQQKSQSYQGIADDSQRLINLEGSLDKVSKYQSNILIVEKRLEQAQTAINGVEAAVKAFKNILNIAASGDADNLNNKQNIGKLARETLNQVVDILNSRDDSRYLFAGGATDQPPVNLQNGTYTSPPPPDNGTNYQTTTDTGYYDGQDALSTIRITDNSSISYGALANDPAFERIIRALDHIAQSQSAEPFNFTDLDGPGSPTQRENLRGILGELSQGLESLNNIRSSVSINQLSLKNAKERHQEFQTFSQRNINDIKSVNTAEVLSKIMDQNTQLQASYRALSKIQSLSLVDYI